MKIAPHNTNIYKWFNTLHGFQLFSPIAIIYFAQVTGSYTAGASLLSAASIAQIALEVPTGVLSDRYGRKKTITFGAICYVASLVLYLIGGSYLWLFLGAVLEGTMRAFYSGNNQSLLYESSLQDGDETYHHDISKAEGRFHLAATVSAVLGGVIAIYSLRLTYVLSLLPAIAMLFVTTRFIEPRRSKSDEQQSLRHFVKAMRHMIHNKRLRLLTAASSLDFGIGHAMFGLQSAFVNTLWPIWAVGVSRALSGLFAALSFSFSGKAIDNLGAIKTLVFSSAWGKLVPLAALVYPNVSSPAILSVSSLSFGSSTVARSFLEQKEFTDDQRATLGSISSVIGALCFSLASVLLGFLADAIGLQQALLVGVVVLIMVNMLYLPLRNRK